MKYILFTLALLSAGIFIGSESGEHLLLTDKQKSVVALREPPPSNLQRCDIGKPFSASNRHFSFNFNAVNKQYPSGVLQKNTFEAMTVFQRKNNLTWWRCGLGATDAYSCDTAKPFGLKDLPSITAKYEHFNAYESYRLPTVSELQSIVERRCEYPAINLSVFPYTKNAGYFASDPVSGGYKVVDFTTGKVKPIKSDEKYYVRLVGETKREEAPYFSVDHVSKIPTIWDLMR
ncbi:DUF1566 domain-containing protein [Alteromonas stellipolaris]|jgi:hypothetical protein|uniref:Lcl C-terminal domain-containing protein n=1 Tax=Alteromonas stellipolaris TaxID=233316 RepID=UPI001DD8C41D|nr:DUF1566 domain-containing protein [Alteromonas stellipolaris]MBZ2163176.1 DUF1566 domain-containing protein [Alteromonas stellipolaris]